MKSEIFFFLGGWEFTKPTFKEHKQVKIPRNLEVSGIFEIYSKHLVRGTCTG